MGDGAVGPGDVEAAGAEGGAESADARSAADPRQGAGPGDGAAEQEGGKAHPVDPAEEGDGVRPG
ncbi:hypothetical protein ACSNOD_25820, partial [Streptomyces sp. URMC 123]